MGKSHTLSVLVHSYCVCGTELEIEDIWIASGEEAVHVQSRPCPVCIEAAEDVANTRGYEEGVEAVRSETP